MIHIFQKSTSGPSQYIPCHLSKVNAIDWSPTNEYQLLTAGQDSTVKIWHIASGQQQPVKPTHETHTPSPVWKARFTVGSAIGAGWPQSRKVTGSIPDQLPCQVYLTTTTRIAALNNGSVSS